MTQITLETGHDYIIATNGTVANISLTNNVLTLTNSAPLDLIDLGKGTRTSRASVCISSIDGVMSI